MAKLVKNLNLKVDERSFERIARLSRKLGLSPSEIARRAIILGTNRLDRVKLPGGPVLDQLELNLQGGPSCKKD